MTRRCADLDEFFDGELAADQADAFRGHLATCERCQRVLDGRMQEDLAVRGPAQRPKRAPAPTPVAPARIAVTSGAPPMAPVRAPGAPVRRRWVRALTYAAPLVAAAAAIPLWLGQRSPPEFQLSLAIERAPTTDRSAGAATPRGAGTATFRGLAAHTGDVLRPAVRGKRHQAIWVYLDEHELILRCPEDARCRGANGELALEFPLITRGNYAIVAVGSAEALPAPGPTLDRTLAAARVAGVRTQVEYVDVD